MIPKPALLPYCTKCHTRLLFGENVRKLCVDKTLHVVKVAKDAECIQIADLERLRRLT